MKEAHQWGRQFPHPNPREASLAAARCRSRSLDGLRRRAIVRPCSRPPVAIWVAGGRPKAGASLSPPDRLSSGQDCACVHGPRCPRASPLWSVDVCFTPAFISCPQMRCCLFDHPQMQPDAASMWTSVAVLPCHSVLCYCYCFVKHQPRLEWTLKLLEPEKLSLAKFRSPFHCVPK